jgi:hypothetical protein
MHAAHRRDSTFAIMTNIPQIAGLVTPFLGGYDQTLADQIWDAHSKEFRDFWTDRVLSVGTDAISDDDCDRVIRILDRNGKGNTKGSEAVAKAMVPQGAWRRLFNEFHVNKPLGKAMNRVLVEQDETAKASAIDEVYAINSGARNHLSGVSGSAIGAILAAWDPRRNLSVISLAHRKAIAEFLGLSVVGNWEAMSIGERMVASNREIMRTAADLALPNNARTVSVFFYNQTVAGLWRRQHEVKVPGGSVTVSVPVEADEADMPQLTPEVADEVRESMQIQAQVARIGAAMGFKIWLPRADRTRVLKAWTPCQGELLDSLPLGFDKTTTATVELIDVLWIDRRAIVRAFEVEHTTAIYSGLLRMADLVALQPKLDIRLHIVAGLNRRDKVMREISRPVFALLEGGDLREKCTYLSYDTIMGLANTPHLRHLSDSVLEDLAEKADVDDAI